MIKITRRSQWIYVIQIICQTVRVLVVCINLHTAFPKQRARCVSVYTSGRSKLLFIVVIPLAQPSRRANSLGQALQKTGIKVTAAEAEAIFVKVGLEVLLGQAMISTQDERLGVANHDV